MYNEIRQKVKGLQTDFTVQGIKKNCTFRDDWVGGSGSKIYYCFILKSNDNVKTRQHLFNIIFIPYIFYCDLNASYSWQIVMRLNKKKLKLNIDKKNIFYNIMWIPQHYRQISKILVYLITR